MMIVHGVIRRFYDRARSIYLLGEIYRAAINIPVIRKIYTGGGKTIPMLVVSVGQACNYKCKNCGTMAPYTLNDVKRYDCSGIIRSLSFVLSAVDKIKLLQVQGGEPFLYSDLDKILEFAGANKKIRQIDIATNGSIMPKDRLLKLIRKNDISIRISDYTLNSDKAKALYKKCRSMGISVRYYKFTSGTSAWYYEGLHEMIRDEDDKTVKKRFRSCRYNGCLTLERNRLYYCSRAVNAVDVQHFTERESDYCKVDDSTAFAGRIRKYINRRHYMEACRYCHGTDKKFLCRPAEQIV